MSLGQSDVPGPEGPTAVARIPGEGGAGIGGGEEDRRPAQQLGEEEKEAGSASSSWSCDLTKGLYFFSFSKSGGRTEIPTVQQKTLTLKERGNFLCGETLTTGGGPSSLVCITLIGYREKHLLGLHPQNAGKAGPDFLPCRRLTFLNMFFFINM